MENKSDKRKDRIYRRHVRAYRFFYWPCKALMKLLYNYTAENAPAVTGPCLVLSNHVTDLDPVLLGCSFKKHMYFVAGENVYRMGLLSKFLSRYFAPIQRLKGTTDSQAAMTILRTLKKGQNVCMFAEGNRTFTGNTLPISEATAKLVKISRSTLITYKLTGGYFTTPRWSSHMRRGKMEGRIVNIYTPEQLKAMSEEEIYTLLKKDLQEDAYETQSQAPVAFKGKDLAEKLETALYLCPRCNRIDTLKSRGNRFSCSCGLTMTIDAFGYFHGKDIPFATPRQWDQWQEEKMRALSGTLGSDPAFFDDDQTLCLRSEDHSLKPLTRGRMSLFRDRLVIGEKAFPLQKLRGLAMIQRDGMVFSTAEEDYVITSPTLRNARKYYTLFHYLKTAQPDS